MEHYNEDGKHFEDEIADLMDLRQVINTFFLLSIKLLNNLFMSPDSEVLLSEGKCVSENC